MEIKEIKTLCLVRVPPGDRWREPDGNEVFETLTELEGYIHKNNEYWDSDYEDMMNKGYKCFLISASVEGSYTEFDVEIFEHGLENVQTHPNIVYMIWMMR